MRAKNVVCRVPNRDTTNKMKADSHCRSNTAYSMSSDQNKPDDTIDLERRLSRLWNDRQSLPIGVGTGQRFGNCEVKRVVGAGAFGIVYLATDLKTGDPVALKIPRTEVLVDTDKLQRFVNEVKLIADLNHPNIVRLLASNIVGLVPWLVTEWCDGPDLGKWIHQQTDKPFDDANWKEVAEFMALVSEAVHHVHQQGIAHRDLKPSNIMLCTKDDSSGDSLGDYFPKVTDFGLSKLHDGELADTQSSVILGTPFYMAPEQMDHHNNRASSSTQATLNSDIYSLGAILFELLTGAPPVRGKNYFEVMANAKSPKRPRASKQQTGLPRGLDRICSICLRLNPEARYESAVELAADLRRYANGEAIAGQSYPIAKRYAYWHRLQPWKKIAGAFTLFYCFVIGLWFTVSACGFFTFNVLPASESLRMVPQAISLVLTSIFLPGIIGWICWSGRTWAAVGGFLLNLPKALVYGSGMLGHPMMFQRYYEHYSSYLTFSVHLFFFICTATQMILYLFAIRSHKG